MEKLLVSSEGQKGPSSGDEIMLDKLQVKKGSLGGI